MEGGCVVQDALRKKTYPVCFLKSRSPLAGALKTSPKYNTNKQ